MSGWDKVSWPQGHDERLASLLKLRMNSNRLGSCWSGLEEKKKSFGMQFHPEVWKKKTVWPAVWRLRDSLKPWNFSKLTWFLLTSAACWNSDRLSSFSERALCTCLFGFLPVHRSTGHRTCLHTIRWWSVKRDKVCVDIYFFTCMFSFALWLGLGNYSYNTRNHKYKQKTPKFTRNTRSL